VNRSKRLQAKAGLSRGTALKAKTGLKRRKPMGRGNVSAPKPKAPAAKRGSMSAAVALVLAGEATAAQAARQFEVDPGRLEGRAWIEAKRIVRERDSRACLSCGRPAVDVHHRILRKAGGTANPVVAFSAQSLVSLCRECHDACHAEKPEMRDRGYMLRTGQDPAEVPVCVRSEWGYERFWLLPDGELSRADPREAEAA
jgi:5-methylcytosine-specific restriction protein A